MLMPLLNYILVFLSLVLLIPVLVLFIQILFACIAKIRLKRLVDDQHSIKPSVGVLIPAHNEEQGLAVTLNTILPQMGSHDQLVVIADNCTDNTASIAKSSGAITLERFNQTLRGKGYALDFGMQHLKLNPPEVVIIIDADCEIKPDFIDVISRQCVKRQRPIQANYVMHYPSTTGLKQQVVEFAWLVKNTVRPLGYGFIGLPCQLMGTGMAFLWKDLVRCNLASGHLVEDMKLGLDLASIGSPTVYSPQIEVISYFPSSEEGQATQRARWEHGHLGVLLGEAPKYMLKAIKSFNLQMFAQVLDLMIPPLALTLIVNIIFWLSALFFWLLTSYYVPLLISTTVLTTLVLGIFIAWVGFGRKIISFKSLLLAPLVLLMKVPLYIKFVLSRQVDWVRSKRDDR
jgi:cellulose synthase/poly-beta-1,6-N-acetylglucosamine synthase-like glycosyltransferase